jgi:hypothetical protein
MKIVVSYPSFTPLVLMLRVILEKKIGVGNTWNDTLRVKAKYSKGGGRGGGLSHILYIHH